MADNGGPTETDALLTGSPAIGAGKNTSCPSTDQRGVTRPQGTSCDIGAFQAAAALSSTNSAPSSGVTNEPLVYTLSVRSAGSGPSTATGLVDQLPAGETLYGANPSQGSCTASGSPARVSCDLGVLNTSATATLTLVVSEANAGSVTAPVTPVTPVTPPAAISRPGAATHGHSHVRRNSAELLGRVTTTGEQPTWYMFQYGTSRKLGKVTTMHRIASAGNAAATVRHLTAGGHYFYRLVAINDSGSSYGAVHKFSTKRPAHRKKHHK